MPGIGPAARAINRVSRVGVEIGAELGTKALEAGTADAEAVEFSSMEGTFSVYQRFNAEGKVEYIGITGREPTIRFAEHLGSG